jgi:hypothetical protein
MIGIVICTFIVCVAVVICVLGRFNRSYCHSYRYDCGGYRSNYVC